MIYPGSLPQSWSAGANRVCTAQRQTPNPVHHEPRTFLSNADFLGHLKRRDGLAGRHHEVHGIDPLVQGDMGSLENGSRPDGEVFAAFVEAA